jgi:2-C-methyl-D-erythritol 4-phosphate cytidylyltransferase / 2-C-methyl-D-erythritol 2,4-cyclodiphosphate synthase
MADSFKRLSPMHVTAIIAAGGMGRRLGAGVPKQLLVLGGRSILQRSVEAFLCHPQVNAVILVVPPAIAGQPPAWTAGHGDRLRIVTGGDRRQDSVANGFDAAVPATDIVLVHDAARPFVSAAVISRTIESAAEHGAAIAAIPVRDTVKRVVRDRDGRVVAETVPRETVFLAQTPQAFRRDVLRDAVEAGRAGAAGTDEAMLAERAGYRVRVVEGDEGNVKITTPGDLGEARAREAGAQAAGRATMRVGAGYDLHRLETGRPLILGGVTIESPVGAVGHSDADVVCHALTDAVLGAAQAGDIGQHYPDTDPRWKGARSVDLLRDAVSLVQQRGFAIENVDVVVILERPKLAPYREAMQGNLSDALGIDPGRVSIKAKTNEGVDAVGRGEAIAAHAVALLGRIAER